MKNLKNYIISLALTGVLVMGIYHIISYSVLFLVPHTFWFNYEKLESVQGRYSLGEKPKFISYNTYYRESDMSWNDILMCDFSDGNGNIFYSSYNTQKKNIQPKTGSGVWIYNLVGPSKNAKCYLDSFSTVNLPYGIEKTQNIQSDIFFFDNKK